MGMAARPFEKAAEKAGGIQSKILYKPHLRCK